MQKNNFDFLRLAFAIFVIIGHSYRLSGIVENDWLSQASNGQLTFLNIGLLGFFSISGYLIFQSLSRSKSLLDYYWKRVLRIFPALFVVLLLTAILGVFVYNSDFRHYLQNKSAWTYLPNNLKLINMQQTIHGIFENNPNPSIINGSLWTIPYEFFLYIVLSCLFFFKTGLKKVMVISGIGGVIFIRFFLFKSLGHFISASTMIKFFSFSFCFLVGALLASLNFEQITSRNKIILLAISIVSLVVFSCIGHYKLIQPVMLPLAVIIIGTSSTKFINNISDKIGDLSYGIYLTGYPIEQTFMHFFKLNYLQLMGITILVSAGFAWFSWNFIEKKALSLKKLMK